ncbi:MAG: DUF11 domain-containing protein [Thermoguttaceae bacterium]|nr:DUF11 domain-containing protein [Thermoguttaceae bacterium]
MITTLLKSKRVVRGAVVMAFATIAFVSVESVYSQIPGFASSREENAGKAESGVRRVFNLNPFKPSVPDFVEQNQNVQQIPTSRPSPSETSRPRQYTTTIEPRTTASSRGVSSARPRTESARRSASRIPSNRAALALIDELEEDFETPPSVSGRQGRSGRTSSSNARRSLREDRGLDSLELLDDESDLDDSVATPSSRKASDVISTEESDSSLIVVEANADEEHADVSTVGKPAMLESATLDESSVEEETLESSDSQSEVVHEATEPVVREPIVKTADLSSFPIVTIETVGPKKLIVGQETVYKIVVRNEGRESARQLIVTTDLPESVEAASVEAQVGSAVFEEVGDRSNAKRCVWRVGTLDSNQERVMALRVTPTKRVAFELVSNFEFERATSRAGVEVQEPILEALIEGRDSIEWGVEDKFRLRLRNVGNGDAEDVELFVSTGENKATQKLGLLRAGEEKVVETSIKTVADGYFTIDVEAVGAYGVKTAASKKIGVLRGKLNVEVEAPELQFVDGEFDAKIHVRNLGDATLQHVDVVAQIPEGVEAVYCSNQARQNPEKRRVYWSAPFLRPNEETVFSVTCRVVSAGTACFEVVGVDQTGVVAQAESATTIESIAVLALRVKAPKEPVAVGKRCVYELVVENNGTKDAQDVNSGVFLGSGLKPISIEGDQGVVFAEESKVLFNKIDCLKAGETVVFRIQAEATRPGNQKVQAMLQSAAEDVSLLSEETTYCYSRVKKDLPTNRRTDVFDQPTMTADKSSEGTLRK